MHLSTFPLSFGSAVRRLCGLFPACGPVLLLTGLLMMPPVSTPAAEPSPFTEREQLAVLQSQAPAGEKALACKRLAVCGTPNAVPALAPLLADEQLSSWARIALEVIPGPAADQALRQAAGKLEGRLLVGVINSIGVRRDPAAVNILIERLRDRQPQVASAAALSLGRIGGNKAAGALRTALSKAAPEVRPAVAEGCIRCAEVYLAANNAAAAAKLYDAVRAAPVPGQKVLEATRGAILARGAKGIPLLVEQLRSPDKGRFSIGLRTAREVPGAQATKAIETELWQADPSRQPMLLLALADRDDPTAMPAIVRAARTGSKPLRITAVKVLDRQGKDSSLPVLLEVAADPDPELSQAAMAALVRLPGTAVDEEVLRQLKEANGKSRRVLIDLAGRRGIEAALPAVAGTLQDPDSETRSAALKTLGLIGGENQLADLAALAQRSSNPAALDEIEAAILAISGRVGGVSVERLQPLEKAAAPGLRVMALRAFAAAGGPAALQRIKAAADDSDETVQDEAVRALSSWPNTWPEDSSAGDALLALAREGKKPSHKVLALRGYLQFLQADKKLKPDDKVARLEEVLPLLQRPGEKRSAVTVAQEIPSAGALKFLVKLAEDQAAADDACSAIVQSASKDIPELSKEERQRALQTVVDKCTQDATRKKARQALEKLR